MSRTVYMASRKHSWAGEHACSSGSLRCSRRVSGQLQVWSPIRKEAEQSSVSDSQSDTIEDRFAPVLGDTEILVNDKFYNEDCCHGTSCSHVNNTLAEMTFCKRTLNSSSSNHTPVAKSGKLENKIVDLSRIPGLDRTWKPEFDDGKDLNNTWMPAALPSHSDKSDEFPDAMSAEIPTECTNFSDAKAPVPWYKHCPDDLCDPCVRQTKNHQISYELKDDEDPLETFENILNSFHPGRKNIDVSSGSCTDFSGLPDIPDLARKLRLIRQNSSSIVNRLTMCNSLEGSTGLDGYPCADSRIGGLVCHDIRMPGAFSRFNSESSSNGGSYKPRKVRASSVNTTSELSSSGNDSIGSGKKASGLTERIIADNLLRILNVDSDAVKIKTAVVIEMLVKSDVVNPSVFCEIRCIRRFKSLRSTSQDGSLFSGPIRHQRRF